MFSCRLVGGNLKKNVKLFNISIFVVLVCKFIYGMFYSLLICV